MSQFFGFISLQNLIDTKSLAESMIKNMSFFDPDIKGQVLTDYIFICNKILFNSIESKNTPAICQSDRFVLAASCRIDNRIELYEKLTLQGEVFGENAISDHEYILKAYEYYQEDCVKHLVGDFAFVVWDKQEEKLFMAKDHMGVRPLFYAHQNNILFFSTDLNAFLNLNLLNLTWSKTYVAALLDNIYPKAEYTCYVEVTRLKPAHRISYKNNELTIGEYWKLKPQEIIILTNKQAYYDEFMRIFKESVACRMRSYFPIGCELSGGLDSSAITCMAAEILGPTKIDKLHTASFVQSDEGRAFSPELREEEKEQDIINKHVGLPPENIHKINYWGFDSVAELFKFDRKINGGLAIVSTSWQKPIYEKLHRANCRTKLSGFLGDNMVTEFGHYWYLDDLKNYLKCLKNNGLIYGSKIILRHLKSRIKPTASEKDELEKSFLNPKYKNLLEGIDGMKVDKSSYSNWRISRTSGNSFTSLRMENEVLNGFAFNLEAVFPMVDIRLLEFMLKIPIDLIRPKSIPRMFFRNATINIIPDQVRLRNDKTINIQIFSPYKNWIFFEELKDLPIENRQFLYEEMINLKKLDNFIRISKMDLQKKPVLLAKLVRIFKLAMKQDLQ